MTTTNSQDDSKSPCGEAAATRYLQVVGDDVWRVQPVLVLGEVDLGRLERLVKVAVRRQHQLRVARAHHLAQVVVRDVHAYLLLAQLPKEQQDNLRQIKKQLGL